MTLDAWIVSTRTPDNVFADKVGVSRVTLYRFKTGKRTPDQATMARIFEATGGSVTPNDFFNIANLSVALPTPEGAS